MIDWQIFSISTSPRPQAIDDSAAPTLVREMGLWTVALVADLEIPNKLRFHCIVRCDVGFTNGTRHQQRSHFTSDDLATSTCNDQMTIGQDIDNVGGNSVGEFSFDRELRIAVEVAIRRVRCSVCAGRTAFVAGRVETKAELIARLLVQ